MKYLYAGSSGVFVLPCMVLCRVRTDQRIHCRSRRRPYFGYAVGLASASFAKGRKYDTKGLVRPRLIG